MPNISASDYTAFIKAQAASYAYRDGLFPTRIQTSAQPYTNKSVLNAQLLASQASYLSASPATVTTTSPATITAASTSTVTDAASRTITSVSSRTVTNAVANGTTVTYTTNVPHGLIAGQTVTINGFATLNLSSQTVLAAGLTSTNFVVANTITAATESSSSGRIGGIVYYTTAVEHGLVAGQTITITNTSTPFNLSAVTVGVVTSSTRFSVTNAADTTNFTGSGATAGRVSSGAGLVFYTTSVPHGLSVGQSIKINNAGATFTQATSVTVAAVTTPYRFSVTSSADSATAYSGTAAGITGFVYYTSTDLVGVQANQANTTLSISGLTTTTGFNLSGFVIAVITDTTHFVVANAFTGTAITGQSGTITYTQFYVPRTVVSGNARVLPYNGKGYVNQPKALSTVHNSTSTVLSSGNFQVTGGNPLTAPKWSGTYAPVPHLAMVDTKATGRYAKTIPGGSYTNNINNGINP